MSALTDERVFSALTNEFVFVRRARARRTTSIC
jgi:hypothetical protein